MKSSYRSTLLYGLMAATMVGGIGYFSTLQRPTPDPIKTVEVEEKQIFKPIPIPVADTKTGLLLAGITAQKRRDWGEAWQHFSSLNEQYLNEPDIALRAFTMAVGNGDFNEALAIAKPIKDKLFETEDMTTKGAPYDLMRLFLILDHIKKGDFETAHARIKILKNSSIIEFTSPILKAWLNAYQSQNTFVIDDKNLNPLQLFYIALADEFAGNQEKASQIMGKLSDDPFMLDKIPHIAFYFKRVGDKDKALDILTQAKLRFPDYKDLGQALVDIHKTQNQSNPNDKYTSHMNGAAYALSMAYHDFSKILISDRAIDSGLLFARMASYLNPEDQEIYSTIGDILAYQKQNDSALEAYSNITPSHPDFERAIAEKINLLETEEKFKEALKLIDQSIHDTEGTDNTYFYYLKGNILKALDRYEEAVQYYNETEKRATATMKANGETELPSKYWPLYYSRGVAYDLIDQWDKAEANMMTALEKYSNNPIILNYLGYSYADKNINLEKALDMLSRAVAAAPNDPYIIDSMGWILYRTGDYERAVTYLERAAQLRPYHMVINDHLGDAYWQLGRIIEAHYMWQRAVDYYDDTNEEQQRMIEETRRKLKEGY